MIDEQPQNTQPEPARHELILIPRDSPHSPNDENQPLNTNPPGTSPGTDEWYCPTCGRRVIIAYPPRYKKIVLVEGDPSAVHSGGKGGVQIYPHHVGEVDPRLEIWQQWMDSVDFESHWNDQRS